MANYEKKEENTINNMAKVLSKLDDSLAELDSLENDPKKHSIKTWFYEKKAIHEMKKIMNDVGKYDNYDDKELDKVEKEYNTLIKD